MIEAPLETEEVSVAHDGSIIKTWTINGLFSRKDGPARTIVDRDGKVIYMEWCIEGKPHRLDGPAIIISHKEVQMKEWWIEGENLTIEEYLSAVPEQNIADIAYHFGECSD